MLRIRKYLIFIVIALLPSISMVLVAESVMAQEKRSFFDKLFGRKKTDKEEETKNIQGTKKANKNSAVRKTNRKKSSSQNKVRSVNAAKKKVSNEAARPQIEKSPQAKRILVIGDFVAAHIADGLSVLYANNPDLLVIKQVELASGLVRDDHYNWPANIGELITNHQPDMIIATLGSNDRQALQLEGQLFDYGSETWILHYRDRVRRLVSSLQPDKHGDEQQNKHILTWLGLPPFQKTQLSANALMLNAYFEEEVKGVGGHFVDIWSGFVDNKGNFDFSGYDAKGQLARLRTADGINFTVNGRDKLAFYANEAVQAFLTRQAGDRLISEIIEAQTPETIALEPQTDSTTTLNRFAHIKYMPPQALFEVPDSQPELANIKRNVSSLIPRSLPLQPGRADYFLNPPTGG